MTTQLNISSALLAVAAIIIAVLGYMGGMQYLQTQAVDQCFKVATVESTRRIDEENKDLKITEPVREIYTYCLEDKGYEVFVK